MQSRTPKGVLCPVCQQTRKVVEVLPPELVRPAGPAIGR